ncbi:divisome protein SepX/GlpR [Nocardia shimofusensis]|uniref:divisome protein SepX/GlpR n=1 Tax=Nocardia shimofusensis TaxID=228596 RepID=UPI0008297ED5|nr:gephyrin-like molybdotransferase receptor GlpR [Nocardia shimofusensis]
MPNSILWIGLVVLWVFVLFPILADRHPRIRQTTDAALATRVLHRGGSKRRLRYRPNRVRRKRFHSDDAEDRMTIPADEKVSDDLAEFLDEATDDRRGKRVASSRSARADAPPRDTDSSDEGWEHVPADIDDGDHGPRRERTIRRGGSNRTAAASDLDAGDTAESADRAASDIAANAGDLEVTGDIEDAGDIENTEVETDGLDGKAERELRTEWAETRQITARIPPARSTAPVRAPDPGYGESDDYRDADYDTDEETDADQRASDRPGSGRRRAERRGSDRRKSGRRNSGSGDVDNDADSDSEPPGPETSGHETPGHETPGSETSGSVTSGNEVGDYESGDAEPEFVPTRRGRGGYDPEADAIARAARYTFRQRAVLALMLTALMTGALGLIISPMFWWGSGLSILVLGAYLAYLRKQVRMEEEIRRRRAARLGRRHRESEDDEFDEHELSAEERVRIATGGMDRATARALRRRSSLLDVDDEDPLFEHLEAFDPATARALRRRTGADSRRQAAGE